MFNVVFVDIPKRIEYIMFIGKGDGADRASFNFTLLLVFFSLKRKMWYKSVCDKTNVGKLLFYPENIFKNMPAKIKIKIIYDFSVKPQ